MFLLTLIAVGFLVWLVMLVDCATKETGPGNERLIWILIILFTHWIGAILYLFVRRPQRIAQLGA